MNADAFFEAARKLAEQITAQRAAHRQAVKDKRNARRRARYATTPKRSRPAKPATVDLDEDLFHEPGCRCQIVATPPCAWCEASGDQP